MWRRRGDILSYNPTNWQDRVVEHPRRFEVQNNPDGTVTLIPKPGTVLQEGTPVNAANMNKLEQGLVSHMAEEAPHSGHATVADVDSIITRLNSVTISKERVFLESGYFTVPAGTTSVTVYAIGGCGGGGGGGGGFCAYGYDDGYRNGTDGENGGAGGVTSFGSLVSASGGAGGAGGKGGRYNTGGAAGGTGGAGYPSGEAGSPGGPSVGYEASSEDMRGGKGGSAVWTSFFDGIALSGAGGDGGRAAIYDESWRKGGSGGGGGSGGCGEVKAQVVSVTPGQVIQVTVGKGGKGGAGGTGYFSTARGMDGKPGADGRLLIKWEESI